MIVINRGTDETFQSTLINLITLEKIEDRLSQMSFYDPGYAEGEQTLARARAEISNLQRAAQ